MEEPASRQFYSIPVLVDDPTRTRTDLGTAAAADEKRTSSNSKQQKGPHSPQDNLFSYVADNIVGSDKVFSGPYGLRTAIYLDFTASGRSVQFIEDYIQQEVLPEYGNTHTTTSITSLQTTLFRHEARDIIRNSCNASEHDSVIFVGSGTTGAIHKLIHSLNLTENPIVFVGPHEHHSNILPWVEIGAEVIRISLTSCGNVDIRQLEELLRVCQPLGRQMLGAFSAASNVTGVLSDVDAITVTLHRHGALAFWDYAAAAPYIKVDMNPYVGGSHQELVYKDAVYFSGHKFVGGVGAPGVLIAKKKLFQNSVPHGCGGGTVFYVRRDHHRYLVEPEMKEEGGTPDIVGSIRAGLVFQLRDAVSTEAIGQRDGVMLGRAFSVWQNLPNLVLLGPPPVATEPLDPPLVAGPTTERLPIVSFMVYHQASGLFLHHNFVAAVLNDVFGIQARGGCACAGPYAMDVLGMSEVVSGKMEELLAEDSRLDRIHLRRVGEYSHREIIRPGFVRINLPYFLDDAGLDFVIQAVKMASQHAWKLLPQYLFNPETGEWRNKHFQTFKDRKWLGHISYSNGRMSYHQPAQVVKGPLPTNYQDCLQKARDLFSQAEKTSLKVPDQSLMFDERAREYRWFLLPSEANACLQNKWKGESVSPADLPFCPPDFLKRLGHPVTSTQLESSRTKVDEIIDRLEKSKKSCVFGEKSLGRNVADCGDCNKIKKEEIKEEGQSGRTEQIVKETDGSSTNILNVLERGFVTTDISGSGGDRRDPCENENTSVVEKEDHDSVVERRNEDVNMSQLSETMSCRLSISRNGNGNDSSVERPGDSQPVTSRGAEGKRKIGDSLNSDIVSSDDLGNACPVGVVCKRVTGNDSSKDVKVSNDASGKGSKVNDNGDGEVKVKGDRGKGWFAPDKSIFKPTVQALEEYNMLQDGDKVLVCLSGGKDSLSLLHTIRQYQFYAKKKGVSFTFGAVTVDPQTPAYDPSPLKRYLAHLGVPYFYESQCIMETANNLPYECASICSFCSRMKRGRIYAAARREGYNVLALGQHLDDLAESFLMSFLHNGNLNTMKAHYTVKEGDLRVIRPFVYVRETELRTFAEQNKLPVISENCPACFEAPKERHRTKQLLAAQEVIFPQVYSSMMSALKPLMARGRRSGGDNAVPGNPDGASPDDDDIDV